MKNIYPIAFVVFALINTISCKDLLNVSEDDLYKGSLKRVNITLSFDEEYASYDKSSFYVILEEITNNNNFTYHTDSDGTLKAEIPYGLYNIRAGGHLTTNSKVLFNGERSRVELTASTTADININLLTSFTGALIIKEVYHAGTQRTPYEGTWQYDQYAIIYNNSETVHYLDELCIGTLDPGNSNATNSWLIDDPENPGSKIIPDTLAVSTAALQFPGNGTDYPLEPGEQAVLVFTGAVDHTVMYPLSVNLNHSDYFVVYDNNIFTNTTYHPAPGPAIQSSRFMKIARKFGTSTAYAVSISSPALILYRVPQEMGELVSYANQDKNTIFKPGSTTPYLKVPIDWVLDGVDVYNGAATNNNKRLKAAVDAGYVTMPTTYQAMTVYRNVDEEATLEIPGNEAFIVRSYSQGNDPSGIDAEATIRKGGRIIYMDSNNSSDDFHARSTQSLRNSSVQ